MPVFRYEAVDKTGRTVKGTMDVPSEQAVAQKLALMGYRPQSIINPSAVTVQPQAAPVAPVQPQASVDQKPRQTPSGHPVSVETCVPLRELAFFYRQLAAYIKAGMTPHQAVSDLRNATRNRKIRNSLERIEERVKSGDRLSSAMAEFPHIFPVHATALVWNGELGGYLDHATDEVASAMEEEVKDNRIARFGWIMMKLSLISFVLSLPAANLKNLLLNSVGSLNTAPKPDIPNLDANLENLGSTGANGGLQALESGVSPTQMMGAIGKAYMHEILRVYLPIIIALIVFWIVWARLKRTPAVKRMLDSAILSIPMWGSIQRERGRARFARSLARLYNAGVSPGTAWDAACLTVRNSAMSERLRSCAPMLRQTEGLHNAVAASGIFTSQAASMIGTGERTGQVSEMAERLADYHDNMVGGLKGQARMWAVHGFIIINLLMMGYISIVMVKTYLELQTQVLPQMLGIPGL